ncbi:MAG: PIN domain-containing protein [Vicinamibacterales bacterium]
MRLLLDTNCVVALASDDHEHHAATYADFRRRRAEGQRIIVAAHAITEAYSVLTRLPPPLRMRPSDAIDVLDRTWGKCETVALTAVELWQVLRECGAAGISGGRTYDRVIAECARRGKAAEILTWNVRHFEGCGIPAVSPVTR